MSGIRTDQLPWTPEPVEFLVNGASGVGRVGIARAAGLIGARIGPTYATRAELFADLDWPADVIGAVTGDATEAHIGQYRKSGAAGSGAWTRIGDLPPNAVGMAALEAEAQARAAAVQAVAEAVEIEAQARDAAVKAVAEAVAAEDAKLALALREAATPALVNIGGTGDAITAELAETAIAAGITTLSATAEVHYTPVSANLAANPTLTVGGTTYAIRDGAGLTWPVGGFVVGRFYRLRRKGGAMWVVSGSPASVGLGRVDNTSDAAKPISIAQLNAMRAGALIHLAQVSRTDANTYAANIPAESRLPPAAGRLYRFIPTASNTGPVTLAVSSTIDGVTTTNTLTLTMGDFPPMSAGTLVNTEPVLIYQYNASYGRILSVPYALHKTLDARVSTLETNPTAGTGLSAGANIAALGDSITAGQGGIDPLADSYPKWAAHLLGCAHTNYGVGGAAMSPVKIPSAQANQVNGSFSRRAAAMDWAMHSYASVAFGENDWRLATPLGNRSDTTEATFWGAMHVGYLAMMASNSHLRVVFVTQGYRCVSASDPTEITSPNSAGHTHEDYRAAIRTFAAKWHLPVIDFLPRAGVGAGNAATYTIDGTHPTEAGRKRLGRVYAAALQALG